MNFAAHREPRGPFPSLPQMRQFLNLDRRRGKVGGAWMRGVIAANALVWLIMDVIDGR
jgi:hypothetical protein